MNIFKEENLFLGKFSLERLNEADRQFWIVAKEVDNILGDRKYLLNFYLSFIFEAMNSTIAFEAAEEGFKNCTELLCLCGDVYNGTKIARNKNIYYKPEFHEFYPHMKEFIDKRSEYQNDDKSNKASIFLWINGLFCKFTEYATNKFFHRAKQKLSACSNIKSLNECYQNMVEITGEDLMEKLNNAIKERFMNVSLSDIYLQSTINQYIDCLMQRDPTTSKYIFRIILDSVKTRA